MDEFHAGRKKTIWLLPGAQETWDDAESLVPPSKTSCLAQFRARIVQLAEAGQLRSPDHMSFEGDGCYAIKATCGLRAWGWFQHFEGKAAFIISHVVLKKTNRADASDLRKTIDAKRQFEENTQ